MTFVRGGRDQGRGDRRAVEFRRLLIPIDLERERFERGGANLDVGRAAVGLRGTQQRWQPHGRLHLPERLRQEHQQVRVLFLLRFRGGQRGRELRVEQFGQSSGQVGIAAERGVAREHDRQVVRRLPTVCFAALDLVEVCLGVALHVSEPIEEQRHEHDHHDDRPRNDEQLHDEACARRLDRRQCVVGRESSARVSGHGWCLGRVGWGLVQV